MISTSLESLLFLPSSPLLMVLQLITSYANWQFTSWGSSGVWPAERSSLPKFTLPRSLNSQKHLLQFLFSAAGAAEREWGRGQDRGENVLKRREALFTLYWVHRLGRWKPDGEKHFQPSCWIRAGVHWTVQHSTRPLCQWRLLLKSVLKSSAQICLLSPFPFKRTLTKNIKI